MQNKEYSEASLNQFHLRVRHHGRTQEGLYPLQKHFEPCSHCGSNFFGGGPDPPGYAPGRHYRKILFFSFTIF